DRHSQPGYPPEHVRVEHDPGRVRRRVYKDRLRPGRYGLFDARDVGLKPFLFVYAHLLRHAAGYLYKLWITGVVRVGDYDFVARIDERQHRHEQRRRAAHRHDDPVRRYVHAVRSPVIVRYGAAELAYPKAVRVARIALVNSGYRLLARGCRASEIRLP